MDELKQENSDLRFVTHKLWGLNNHLFKQLIILKEPN